MLGPTGATTVYIFDVISSPTADRAIKFVLSNGSQYTPFFRFTGPTVSYFDSRGLCAEYTSTAFSVWSGISAGMTFQFRGITGDGQYITPSLTTDKKELLLTIGNLSAAGTPAYGNTGDDFISYTTPTYTATNTQIKVINQNFEESASGFAGSTDTTALEFGLTGIAATNASKVRVYSDFETPYISIDQLTRGDSTNPNGYTLDLTKSSVFKLTTPVGIASFSDTNLTNAYKSWLFFIEGSDVWNLPNNLLFDSGITGIGNYGFTPGMNLLRITKSPGSSNYIGTFIDRFIGANNTVGLQFGGIGSCCKTDGTCQDYTTQENCVNIGGSYTALKSCSQSCNIGSCCINGICFNNINRDTCLALTGNASAWSGNACSLGEGEICAPGTNVYQLTNSYTINQNPILLEENNVKLNDTRTWVEIYRFTVKTDDPNAKINIDETVNSNSVGCKFTLDPGNIISQKTVSNTGTSIVSVYFAGFTGVVTDAANNQTISWNIRLTTATGSLTSYGGLDNRLEYNNLKIIKKPVVVNNIQAYFKAQRYCLDCYGLKTINSGSYDGNHQNTETSKRKYYPIQEQYGTCLFSLTSNNDAINLLSVRVGDVREVNDCRFSDAETEYYACNTCTGKTRPTTVCPHIDYQFDPTANRAIRSNYCKTARQLITGLGLNQGFTPTYSNYAGLNAKGDLVDFSNPTGSIIGATSPYWFDITFNDQHSLISKLSASSVTTEANMKSVLDDLKNKLYSTSNTNGSLFFNKTNVNSALTVVAGNSSCAPGVTAQHADLYNITLDFTTPPTGAGTSYRYFLHSFKTTYGIECSNECNKVSGGTNSLVVYDERVKLSAQRQTYLHSDGYYILHKAIVNTTTTNLNDINAPGEFLVFPMGSCKDKGYFVRDCIGPKFDCKYTYMDTSTPKYVGEITQLDTINGKLQVNVSKTIPAELLDTCHTADCLQYMNYQGLTYGLNENQFVSVNCSYTAPVLLSSGTQQYRLQYQWWAYNYFLAPKICGGNAPTLYQWQSTPSGCNSVPAIVPPQHQYDPKISTFCYNYNQTTTSNRIASYLYTFNSSGATGFQMYYYGWNDGSYPNWTAKTLTTTYTNRANLTSYATSVSNDTTTYPVVFTTTVAQTSNTYPATDTINVPFNKAFWFYTTGVNNALTLPTGSLPTGITAPVLIDKFANTSKRNLPEIFFNLTPRVTTTTPLSNSYFDFEITPSSEYDLSSEYLDWELDGRVTTVYLPLITGNTILHYKDFSTPNSIQLSSLKTPSDNSINTLKFSDFAASAKDGNDVLLTVNVIQMFYRKNGAESANQNYKWVEKTRTFRIKYPTAGLIGSTSRTTDLPVATQLKRITNLVGDSQCVSINCETSPYLCLSLENC